MESRTYTIRTVSDLFKAVTTENVERLVADLDVLLRTVACVKETSGAPPMREFQWIDDGQAETYIGHAAPD